MSAVPFGITGIDILREGQKNRKHPPFLSQISKERAEEVDYTSFYATSITGSLIEKRYYPFTKIESEEEISELEQKRESLIEGIKDFELLKLVEKSEAFSFLAKESENIYSLKDGVLINERWKEEI